MWTEGPGKEPSGFEIQGSFVPLAPAIALPLRSKTTFSCPPNHLEKLQQRLKECDRLLVVGWRAQDQHFLKLLTRAAAVIPTCIATYTQSGTEEVSGTLGRTGFIGRHALVHGGFAKLFEHPGFAELLTRS